MALHCAGLQGLLGKPCVPQPGNFVFAAHVTGTPLQHVAGRKSRVESTNYWIHSDAQSSVKDHSACCAASQTHSKVVFRSPWQDRCWAHSRIQRLARESLDAIYPTFKGLIVLSSKPRLTSDMPALSPL